MSPYREPPIGSPPRFFRFRAPNEIKLYLLVEIVPTATHPGQSESETSSCAGEPAVVALCRRFGREPMGGFPDGGVLILKQDVCWRGCSLNLNPLVGWVAILLLLMANLCQQKR